MINDKWGRQVGDDVLVNFGKLLSRSLREFDLTYRLGGDELAILFNGCPPEKALRVAERVRTFIATHVYHVGDVDFTLTLSGGLVALKDREDEKTLLKRADQLLLAAKNKGGNQICHDGSG